MSSVSDNQVNAVSPNASVTPPPLAIVGIGCLFPKADGPDVYWHNIKEGVDAISEVPDSHWNPEDYFDDDPSKPDMTYAHRGGFIDPVNFDPLHFGIAPNNIEATDTTQLLGMYVAEQALLDAGYETGSGTGDGKAFDRDRCSVIMGVTGTLELVIPLGARLSHPLWRKALSDAGVDKATADNVVQRIADGYVPWQENSFPGLLGNVAAGRIANRFDLGGTNCVVDAACASSLSAIHMAAMELYAGRSDMAITGGLDTFNDIFMYMCFSKTPALSPTGNSKPFSASGDGTILGEGLGVVVLKRLDDAQRDGDKIYCIIKGIGTSSDGKGNAIYAPSVKGQTKCLRDAYKTADVTPDTIELIEAHGTGTKVGDATEVNAIEEVYGEAARQRGHASAQSEIQNPKSEIKNPWVAIGSVKSMVGHTKAAAGVAGLIKAALAVNRKVLPPTIKVDQPLEVLGQSKHVYVNSEKRPWLGRQNHPRRAALSAFGFGGSNFHCVVEEAAATRDVANAAIDWSGRVQIVPLSADSVDGMRTQLQSLATELESEDANLRDLAANYRSRFDAADNCRLILVIESGKTDIAKLIANANSMLTAKAGHRSWSSPDGAFFGQGEKSEHGEKTGDLAFIFPGQGSQYVNMLRDLACQFPQMLGALEAANAEFERSEVDVALSDLIYPRAVFNDADRERNDDALRDTRVAQPAIGATSFGAMSVLAHFGVKPDAVAGHSFGELTALAAGGRMNERSLYRLARQRGALMANVVVGQGDRGTMLAVQALREDVQRIVDASGLALSIANHNSPQQTVISGATHVIEQAERLFTDQGMRCKQLPVAAAFHSPLVSDACEPFARALEHIAIDPGDDAVGRSGRPVAVYANTTAAAYPRDAATTREMLAGQLARPVEFVRQIETMFQSGVRVFVEVGPANKLTGLIRSILGTMGDDDARGDTAQAFALDASSGRRHGEYDLACTLAQIAVTGRSVDLVKWDDPSLRRPTRAINKRRMTIALTGANYVKPRPAQPATPPAPTPAARGIAPATPQDMPQATPLTAAATNVTQKPNRPPESKPAPVPSSRPAIAQPRSTQSQPPFTPSNRDPVTQSSPQPESPSSATPVPPPEHLTYALQVTQQHILALQRMQEQTAQLHKQYLEGQETSQQTIQQLVLQQQQLLAGSLGSPGVQVPQPQVPAAAPAVVQTPPAQPQIPTPPQAPLPVPAVAPASASPPVAPHAPKAAPMAPPTPTAPTPTPTPAPASAQAPTATSGRFESLLLEVVADKTGYPVDMLELDMSLDADLGIDSIKRVEILSAFQDRAPDATPVKPEDLGALQTLRQIIEFVDGASAQAAHAANDVPSAPATTTTPDSAAAPTNVAGNGALESVLLEVVADKTGYPVDMLELDMSLDADLGIDSIKRVEILSAFQDRVPDAPPVKPEDLGALQTLRQIVTFLNGAPPSASPPVTPVPAGEAPDPFDSAVAGAGLARLVLTTATQDQTAARSRKIVNWPSGSTVYVTDDGAGLSTHVAEQFRRHGYDASVVSLDDPTVLASEAAAVVLVAPSPTLADFNRRAFLFLQQSHARLSAFFKRTQSSPSLVGVCRMDGAFGLAGVAQESSESAGLCGMIKTAAREWSDIHCKVVDVAPALSADIAAERLVDECLRIGPIEVGISSAGTSVPQLVADSEVNVGPFPLNTGDVVLITGGARGVTAEVAVALGQQCQPTLVLLGRSPLAGDQPEWLQGITDETAIKKQLIANWQDGMPSPRAIQAAYEQLLATREIRENIERMTAAGARVIYRCVDIRNADDVASMVADIRRQHGAIRGIIHGAGVLADRLILDKTAEQFDRVYGTKVDGLRSILHATQSDDLRVLVTFSSSTARFGRVGQSDYATANEVLNKMAQQQARQRPQCKVLSINWGPWDGGMVTPALKQLFADEGVAVIPLQAGAQYLVRELSSPLGGPIEIVILGEGSQVDVAIQPADQVEVERDENRETLEAQAAAESAPALPTVFERVVSIESHPFLRGHVIGGRAVLPMAVMIEWMAHGAMHSNPGMVFAGFDALRVFRGVKLELEQSLAIQICAATPRFDAAGEHVDVELRCGEVLHARAALLLKPEFDGNPDAAQSPLPVGQYPHEHAAIYQSSRLFHGPELQGIRTVEACDHTGIIGSSEAAPIPAQWMVNPWRSTWLADPMAMDVAFQLMILWSIEQAEAPSLPTGAASYRQYVTRFPSEGVRVVCRVTELKPYAATADIDFLDMSSGLVARMEGYECVVEGALRESFEQNILPDQVKART